MCNNVFNGMMIVDRYDNKSIAIYTRSTNVLIKNSTANNLIVTKIPLHAIFYIIRIFGQKVGTEIIDKTC